MTVLVIPNLQKEKAKEITLQALALLQQNHVRVCMENALQPCFGACEPVEFCTLEQGFSACDSVITIGGDGTILRAARQGMAYHKPILGINVGRLGFLATVEPNELHKLQLFIDGRCRTDKRSVLHGCTLQDGKNYMALNDLVIKRTTPMQAMDIQIFCDDIPVNSFYGDGVVIATPTGSTAYSLSAGGPILDAKIAGTVVTPLCAHSMKSPPMVFSAERKLRVEVDCDDALLGCDGAVVSRLEQGDKVEITCAKDCITLVSFNDAEQFEAIDNKLRGR